LKNMRRKLLIFSVGLVLSITLKPIRIIAQQRDAPLKNEKPLEKQKNESTNNKGITGNGITSPIPNPTDPSQSSAGKEKQDRSNKPDQQRDWMKLFYELLASPLAPQWMGVLVTAGAAVIAIFALA